MNAAAEAVHARPGASLLGQVRWTPLLRGGSLAVVAAALLLGAALGEPQAIITALIGLSLGLAIVLAGFRGPERRFLLTLFLVAFGLRIAGAVASHFVLLHLGRGGFLLLDDRAYDKLGWTLARVWMGIFPGIRDTDEYLMVNYTYLVAGVYYFLGHSLLAAKMMNVAFGSLLAVTMYALARELFDQRTGRLTALLCAFFPSLLVWSIINLKDVLVVLLTASAMLGLLAYARRHVWWGLVLALGTFWGIENLRQFVFFVMAWLLPLAFLVADRSRLPRKLAYVAPLIAGIVAISLITSNEKFGLNYLTPKALTEAEWARHVGARGAETGIEGLDVKPPKEMETITHRTVDYLPRGVFYVVFGPTPWEARSELARAVIPEMLAWYALLAAALVGVVLSFRRRWRDLFLPLSFTAGWVMVLAVTSGNTGNIFRHRSMYMPFVFLMATVGLQWLWVRWQARRLRPTRLAVGGTHTREGSS